MLSDFIRFYSTLWHHYLLSHVYREEFIEEDDHYYYRRFTQRYQRKQSIVKNFWIVAGLIMLLFPFPVLTIIVLIVTTFLSFSFLDETE